MKNTLLILKIFLLFGVCAANAFEMRPQVPLNSGWSAHRPIDLGEPLDTIFGESEWIFNRTNKQTKSSYTIQVRRIKNRSIDKNAWRASSWNRVLFSGPNAIINGANIVASEVVRYSEPRYIVRFDTPGESGTPLRSMAMAMQLDGDLMLFIYDDPDRVISAEDGREVREFFNLVKFND